MYISNFPDTTVYSLVCIVFLLFLWVPLHGQLKLFTVWEYDSVTHWQVYSKNKNKKETKTNIKMMALMLDRPTNFKYIQDFQYMSVLCSIRNFGFVCKSWN